MAVQQEIKSQLAKLLATEDLVVEHRQVSTAQFDVHSRVLTLPMWEKASGVVYDMLVGHEVGHALYTPDEWDWRDKIPQQFMNVVEDVRIEKLMKRKYLGIAKTFFRGYNELQEKDFFEIADEDYNSFNLADRVNLYYKIGSFINVSFTDAEKEIVDLIGKCETFEDVKKAAFALYQYCQKQQEQEEKISLENQPKKGTDDVELNSEGQTEDGKEGEEESEIESPQTPQMEESGSDRGEVQEQPQEPEVRTADALDEKLQSLVNDQATENVYVELPKLNLDTVIAKNSEIHKVIDEHFIQSEVDHTERVKRYSEYGAASDLPKSPFEETDKSFTQFKRDAQKEVNYLVKEFECRKAASSYARATTSRTGVLDTTKLHTYRYNEDLFKKITTLPDGKNHGLVFVLDWSGSMQYVLQDTLKQLYNLIWFCRKVSIPFDVYAFSNEWSREARYTDKKLPKHYEEAEGLLKVEEYFNMMNILTSKTNAKTLEKQLLNIWRIAECFAKRTYFRYPERMTLSGTPLNESIISLHQILPKFQKENRVEKVQCIILTDGEGSQIPYHKLIDDSYFGTEEEPFLGTRGVRPGRTFLRDRKVGKTYGFQYEYHQFTDVLLNNIKDKFPSTNFIGIRVLPNREASRFMRLYHPYGNDKLSEDWRKNRSFTIKNSGYDAYFAMSAQSLADDTEFEVQEDATKAQIKRAFVKSLKTKKLNKKVLGEFVSLVA